MKKISKKRKKVVNKKNRGKFVGDANADRNYIEIACLSGWEEIHIPSNDFQKRLSDPNILTKYTKGTHPIFTADKIAYKLTTNQLQNSGFIIHKVPRKGKESEEYKKQIKKFFTTYKESDTHRMRWTIEFEGEHSNEELE